MKGQCRLEEEVLRCLTGRATVTHSSYPCPGTGKVSGLCAGPQCIINSMHPHDFCLTSNRVKYNNLITLLCKLIVLPYCSHSAWFNSPFNVKNINNNSFSSKKHQISVIYNKPNHKMHFTIVFTQTAACLHNLAPHRIPMAFTNLRDKQILRRHSKSKFILFSFPEMAVARKN